MYATHSLLIWLACITPALAATVTPSPSTSTSDTIKATLDAQGVITIDTPQAIANLLTPHFDNTCSAVPGKKRLRKRGLTTDDQTCIALSAYSLAVFAASNLQVQGALSTIPLNFDVSAGLINVKNKLRDKIRQNPSRFTATVFSSQRINPTIAYLTAVADSEWDKGAGEGIAHIVLTPADTETEPTRSCSLWTFMWTSPTSSSTTVPAAPCVPVETGITYEGTDPTLWAAELAQFSSLMRGLSNSTTASRTSASTSVPTQSPSAVASTAFEPGDTICRPKEAWYDKCQLPVTKDSEIDSCIDALQDLTQNPTWVGTMQPGSPNISMPCSTNKGTVYQLLIVSWVPGCQAATPDGKMDVTNPTGSSDPFSDYIIKNIYRKIFDGCRYFGVSLDPQTQMFYMVPGSAGLGQKIGNLPHQGNVLPYNADNGGIGGKRQIGCLMYEIAASKNNDGINNDMTPFVKGHEGVRIFPNAAARTQFYRDNWPYLMSNFSALPYGNGSGVYCPLIGPPPVYPCPAFPCWNGPPENPKSTPNPVPNRPPYGVPHHDELLVLQNHSLNSSAAFSNSTSSNTTSSAPTSSSTVSSEELPSNIQQL